MHVCVINRPNVAYVGEMLVLDTDNETPLTMATVSNSFEYCRALFYDEVRPHGFFY